MTDIVERLRELQEDESQVVGTDPRDAADEIERLKAELKQANAVVEAVKDCKWEAEDLGGWSSVWGWRKVIAALETEQGDSDE